MAYSKSIIFFGIIITVTACFYGVCLAQTCNDGWFGNNCQFQCHCAVGTRCTKGGGICNNSGCDSAWFGPGCQYDVSKFTVSEPSGSNLASLTDNDDTTCNNDFVQSITVSLNTAHPLTWIRVVFSNEAYSNQFELSYQISGSETSTPCPDARSARVDDTTLDISCPTSDVVSHVTLSGDIVTKLCSLYISGGRNVALKQTAEQSSRYLDRYASLAVDGDPSASSGSVCTHTAIDVSSAWWRLTFSNAVKINRFVIYNRQDCCLERLASLLLRAYSSFSTNLVFSYTAPSGNGQAVYSVVPSPGIAEAVNSVRIDEGAPSNDILQLCEVFVYGEVVCPSGKFGLRCESDCNCADTDETCFVSTGGCPSGCAPGFTGEACYTPCETGRYGPGCNETCSNYCAGTTKNCDRFDGSCNDGCMPGYQQPLCKEECESGKYGENCGQTCSEHCAGEPDTCHHVDGTCDPGCDPGYQMPLCINTCSSGTYGLNCGQTCSVNCAGAGDPCHHVNGRCLQGCDPGYQGDQCNTPCSSGTHGLNCGQTCSVNCAGERNPCYHVGGRCLQGCDPGYQGDPCSTPCSSGTYGLNCGQTCSVNCRGAGNPCHHVDGRCLQGCDSGYQGDQCNTPCSSGTYGSNCGQACNENCAGEGNPCHHVNGRCLQECDPGFQGDQCNTQCSSGTYGRNCGQICSENCAGVGDPCHYVDGRCLQGCDPDFQGDQCNTRDCPTGTFGPGCLQNCSVNCAGADDACDDVYGFCEFGCDPGYQTVQCDVKCEAGKYGKDCEESCSEHCYGGSTTCDHVDGACYQGCEDGYQRPLCKASLTQEDETNESSQDMWAIIGGVIAAFVVFDVVGVAIFCYIRRRRLSNNERGISGDRAVANVAIPSQPESPADDQARVTRRYDEAIITGHERQPYETYFDHYDTPDEVIKNSGLYVNESNDDPNVSSNQSGMQVKIDGKEQRAYVNLARTDN